MDPAHEQTALNLRTVPADLSAGLVVFLVALPLCLGIALASGAPLFSGLLAGIVGGLVVGVVSRSATSVSGPAAGLTAVVAAQIAALGSFEAFLLAVVLAGAMQVALGVAQAGSIADFVPTSVIKGLLAAIGLILILKQIPHLVGHDTDPQGEMSFRQPDSETTFSELGSMFSDLHAGAALVGGVSLALLILWGKSKRLKSSLLPGPLVAVLAGVALSALLTRWGAPWRIDGSHLVQVPVPDSLSGLVSFLSFPDWTALGNARLYTAAITIAAVASLETLLNLEAVDKLDPQRRVSPPNRELVAQGVGNMVSGLIGGLPVTSVIVRSSVNINAGGQTRLSTQFHGALLLTSVMFLPTWLNLIPLSSLAAVLIVTGYKLASPKVLRQMWRSGWDQFLPFAITVIAILLTDLLVGILIGLATGIVFILRSNLRSPLEQVRERRLGQEILRIKLAKQVGFLNRVAISQALNAVPRDGHVLIDASETDYIDADVLGLIRDFEREVAPAHGVQVSLLGFKSHYEPFEDRVKFVDHATEELQTQLKPDDVIELLAAGNQRFQSGETISRDLSKQRAAAVDGRHPLAVILSGISSRTPVEIIFDVGVGNVFCTRATANFAGDGVLGSLEYATFVAGAKLIVVLGHTRNNVVRMAVEHYLKSAQGPRPSSSQFLDPILADIQESIDPSRVTDWHDMSRGQQDAYIDELARTHVSHTVRRILQKSKAIRMRADAGRIKVIGALYDVESGAVSLFSSERSPAQVADSA